MDNLASKNVLDRNKCWNQANCKKIVIHRSRWIKLYTIVEIVWKTSGTPYYNDLRASVGWKVLDEKQASAGLENSCFVTAAYDGEEPVGSARVVGDNGYMFLIADVMVRPDHQGSGIGRKMVELINEWFEDQGSGGRCIMINLMATKGNEGFYQQLGYTARPNETMGAGMVRWINP